MSATMTVNAATSRAAQHHRATLTRNAPSNAVVVLITTPVVQAVHDGCHPSNRRKSAEDRIRPTRFRATSYSDINTDKWVHDHLLIEPQHRRRKGFEISLSEARGDYQEPSVLKSRLRKVA